MRAIGMQAVVERRTVEEGVLSISEIGLKNLFQSQTKLILIDRKTKAGNPASL